MPTMVAPYMGAWIEMEKLGMEYLYSVWSLPTWERGLKCLLCNRDQASCQVAPYMGAWIEIVIALYTMPLYEVAPYMGAWIEMHSTISRSGLSQSRSLHGSVD